jgi:hypothetical protein
MSPPLGDRGGRLNRREDAVKRVRVPNSRARHAEPYLRCLQLLLVSALLIGGIALGANADVIQISSPEDSFVEDSEPTVNFGFLGGLYVGDKVPGAPNSIARTYIKFDLSSIPAGAVVNAGTLYLYNTVIYYPAVTVGAHFLSNDSWTEGSITWNNAPTGYNASPTDSKTISMAVWTSWDVTPDVQAEWAGDGVYSVVMKEPAADEGADGNYVLFNSNDDPQPGDRPYLQIDYSPDTAVAEMRTSWAMIKAMFD